MNTTKLINSFKSLKFKKFLVQNYIMICVLNY